MFDSRDPLSAGWKRWKRLKGPQCRRNNVRILALVCVDQQWFYSKRRCEVCVSPATNHKGNKEITHCPTVCSFPFVFTPNDWDLAKRSRRSGRQPRRASEWCLATNEKEHVCKPYHNMLEITVFSSLNLVALEDRIVELTLRLVLPTSFVGSFRRPSRSRVALKAEYRTVAAAWWQKAKRFSKKEEGKVDES